MAHTARFLSTLSLRRATGDKFRQGRNEQFLSTLSLRRATNQHPPGTTRTTYFYPRSPCGERRFGAKKMRRSGYFYPRSPCGERLVAGLALPLRLRFLSTLSLRRATSSLLYISTMSKISIHALLAESDRIALAFYNKLGAISIHALLAESDRIALAFYNKLGAISIHALLAESDHPKMSDHPHNTNFYPRSPCGERRLYRLSLIFFRRNFYPRSPCGERLVIIDECRCTQIFLSTLSLRRATALPPKQALFAQDFYPRSPCGERLRSRGICSTVRRDFYPRSPCGERRSQDEGCRQLHGISIHALLAESDLPVFGLDRKQRGFLSTLSLRRATGRISRPSLDFGISIHALLAESDIRQGAVLRQIRISIHALLAESDRRGHQGAGSSPDFYPRSPCGERPDGKLTEYSTTDISIHALLAESDNDYERGSYANSISIHALLAESDHKLCEATRAAYEFLSTLSLRRATIATG